MMLNLIFFNTFFDKNRLKALVLWSLTNSGEKLTIDLVEKLKTAGFHYATEAGLSLSIDDLKIPPTKAELILEAELILQESQKEYEIGNLTSIEKFQQLIDVWHRTSEVLKQNVIQHFRATDILNPVYMMAVSGARGNISQVRQLVGMRGLMADPQGQILDFPIRSNFREGLTLTEYVISCYGARKGLVDTALRTANSGYLTRRLVDVAQHIIVRQLDCGTNTGILLNDMKDGNKVIFSLKKRLIGRVLAEKIDSLAQKNQDISQTLATKISLIKNQVLVRSPLTCEAKNSICQLCYGWSLAHGNLVSLGEAVGVLAAQSIGEPGTQLTMRTFHTGGVFSGDVMQEIRSPFSGIVKFSSPLQGRLIRTLHGKIAFLTKMEGVLTICRLNALESSKTIYQIPNLTVLFIRQLEIVKRKQLLAEFSSFVTSNNKGIQAKYNLKSEKEGQIYFENVFLVVKCGKEDDIIKTSLKFGSIWILAGKLYQSPIRSNSFIKEGDLIDTKSILSQSIFATPYTGILEYSKTRNQKKFILSRKVNYSINESNFFKFLLTENKPFLQSVNKNLFNKKNIFLQNKKFKLRQPFGKFFLKTIHYKKFGYFFSLTNLENIKFFFFNSLNNHSNDLKNIHLQCFFKDNIQFKGKLYKNTKKLFFQKDEHYLIERNEYCISSTFKNKKIKDILLHNFQFKKNTNLIQILNFQGNKTKINTKNKRIISLKSINFNDTKTNLFQTKKNLSLPNKIASLNKKIVSFKKNPYQLKSFFLLENINRLKDENINKYQLPKYFSKIKIKKNLYNDFIKKNHYINSIPVKLILEFGWISFPKTTLDCFLLHKSFQKNGINYSKNFNFDQHYCYTKIIKREEKNSYFSKLHLLKNIRYIENKFSRINKFTNNIFFIQYKKEKNITRNKIYLKNFYIKNKLFFLTKKTKPLNSLNILTKKYFFRILTNNFSKLKYYNTKDFLFNKQTITRLKLISPSVDLMVITSSTKKNKPFPISLNFNCFPISSKEKANLKFSFPIYFELSIIRKIDTLNENVTKNLTNEKITINKENQIFEQNSLSFNSFFSPYTGEITTTKKDLIGANASAKIQESFKLNSSKLPRNSKSEGKEKNLLLTPTDQISFFNDRKLSLIKIGQLVRYGDSLFSKIAVHESGQIIQIDKNKITLRKAQPILFSSQGVFHVDNGDLVEKNSPLITLFYQKLKTEDIVQGIPKIEELFEARQTKEGESLQENLHTKLQIFFNLYKQQYSSQEASRKSIEKIQQILVNNVQKVYQAQGVSIADKHIEIIVRQMTTKVKITESGRTGLLRGELVDLEWVELINLGIEAQNKILKQSLDMEKAEYEPIILGITKAALETESFISAASFQETTRILSRAAIERKTDFLRGLKENVILGHLIPAGTGFSLSFDPTIPDLNPLKKLSWLTYKDIMQIFRK